MAEVIDVAELRICNSLVLAKANMFDKRLDFDIQTSYTVHKRERVFNRLTKCLAKIQLRSEHVWPHVFNVALDNYVSYGILRVNVEMHCRNTASCKLRKNSPPVNRLTVQNTVERITKRVSAT